MTTLLSHEHEDEGVTLLHRYVRDLAALSSLLSVSAERNPQEVVDGFLDLLVRSLRLDLAYARLCGPFGDVTHEAARIAGHVELGRRVEHVGRELVPLLGAATYTTVADPLGRGTMLRAAVVPLAMGAGSVAVLSRRQGFPSELESTVLGAALNQLLLWLSMTRAVGSVRRAEAKLAERESSHSKLEDENAYLREEMQVALAFGGLVGQSQALHDILSEVELVAKTDATVLILGESGTGKELLAREIHERSRRVGRPLIKVNCSAIPRDMFESEFFGHVRGAFTGAHRDRPGRFQLAEGGTIFLDEVADLPLDLQPKLLRVLQEGQFERVGDDTTRTVDVRVIAATNRDLSGDVGAGRFREDLYYRLSVFPVRIPPLRDRKEDITPLAAHFVGQISSQLGEPAPQITERQSAALRSYDWPGNVRELQNVVERAVILSRGGELRIDEILSGHAGEARPRSSPMPVPSPPAPVPPEIVSDSEWRRRERENLIAALARTDGRIYGTGGAAELLGVKPSTLQSRLRALGIR